MTFPTVEAQSRMSFTEISSPVPLHAMLVAVHELSLSKQPEGKRVLTVTGRSRRLAAENHSQEMKTLIEEHGQVPSEVRKTMGDVASAFIMTGSSSGVMILQAASKQDS